MRTIGSRRRRLDSARWTKVRHAKPACQSAGIGPSRRRDFTGPNRGHYPLAQLIGFSAQTQRGADVKPMLNQMVGESELAIKIDEKFDSGGPLRMLGTVYTRAPAPPVAIGDPEKACSFSLSGRCGPRSTHSM